MRIKPWGYCVIFLLQSLMCLAAVPEIKVSAHSYFEENKTLDAYPLAINDVKINLHIDGYLIETQVILTVMNAGDETNLEGRLFFPLPEHAVVSGYALDVEGTMIDGVIVEKKKANFAYESIVAEKIDPGILELQEGEGFSTKIFPIEPGQARTVSITFINKLIGPQGVRDFRLPLRFDREIGHLSVDVNADHLGEAPLLQLPAPLQLKLQRKGKTYHALKSWHRLQPEGELFVSLPSSVNRLKWLVKANKEESFFIINDKPKPIKQVLNQSPENMTIFWDASLSRADDDIDKELALLRHFYVTHKTSLTRVDVVVLRLHCYVTHTFEFGGAGEEGAEKIESLLSMLNEIKYDGATDLSVLNDYPTQDDMDLYLLFTDGINTFLQAPVNIKHRPLKIISSAPDARLDYLKRLAAGSFYHVKDFEPDVLAARLGNDVYQYLGFTVDDHSATDIYPRLPEPVDNYFQVYGRMTGKQARINLHYGVGDKVLHTSTHVIRTESGKRTDGNSLPSLWAIKKIEHLSGNDEDDRSAIIETSAHYGLATPYTNLLVLEDIDQYVEHGIRPPAFMSEWVEEFDQYTAETAAEMKTAEREHLNEILAAWDAMKRWWQQPIDLKSLKHELQETEGEMPFSVNPPDASSVMRRVGTSDESVLEEAVVTGIRASIEPELTIRLQPWTPDRPYLQAIRRAKAESYFSVYVDQRRSYAAVPAFYLDMADFFYSKNEPALARQILSNLFELKSEDYTLPRVAGYKFHEQGDFDLAIQALEKMVELHPDEPQSHRDLALALIARADALFTHHKAGTPDRGMVNDYLKALELLYGVVTTIWPEEFEGIEMIALMELNPVVARVRSLGVEHPEIDPRLVALLDLDLRVVISWNAVDTDIDLWVFEPPPYGRKIYYSNPNSPLGGKISNDMTQGFGPEEYILKKAASGTYQILVDYFSSGGIQAVGPVKVKADVYTNFGRPNQTHKTLMLELEETEHQRQFKVGEVELQ